MRFAFAALALAVLIAVDASAQSGIHPQSLGFGLDWIHDKDSVFAMVREGNFRRMLHVNPSTKEWRWLSTDDFPSGASGMVAMKNRDEGVILNLTGAAPHYTTDGWKTVTPATGTFAGLNQVVVTESGYAGYGVASRGLYYSADGKAWATAEGGPAFSGGGLLRRHKDKVVVLGGSMAMVSTDGGKKYEVVNHTGMTGASNLIDFRMITADSFLVVTGTGIQLSADGGKTWKAGPALAFTPYRLAWKTHDEFAVSVQNSTKIHFTKDGGATWTSKEGPVDFMSYGSIAYIGDAFYVWPGYRSTDGGDSWAPWFPGWLNASGSGGAFAIAFNGDFGGVGLTGGKIAFTWDKGRSFTYMDTLPGKLDVMALKILKENRILAGDRNGQVFLSTDTGKTWTLKLQNGFSHNAVKFSVSADEKVMVLTRLGQPAASVDNGAKWDFLPSMGGQLSQTVKPDGTIIGMIGGESAILFPDKTREKIDSIPGDQGPEDVIAVDDKVGYVVTRVSSPLTAPSAITDNRVYKTEDGFKKLAQVATLEKLNWGALGTGSARFQLVKPDFLVLQSEGRTFHLVSRDGGKTWTKDSLDVHAKYGTTYPSLRRVHYFNENEKLIALTGQALYLHIAATGPFSNGVRGDAARRVARRAFTAAYDARSGIVRLQGLKGISDLSVHDVRGGRVLSRRGASGAQPLDVAALPKGLYVVRARLASGEALTARFLKH